MGAFKPWHFVVLMLFIALLIIPLVLLIFVAIKVGSKQNSKNGVRVVEVVRQMDGESTQEIKTGDTYKVVNVKDSN